MAISKVIRGGGDEDGAYSRWELPEIGEPGRGAERPPVARPAMTVKEIEALQKKAYDEAYARGHEEGRVAGERAGAAAGEKRAREQAESLQKILRALDKPLALLDEEVEQQLLQLALVLSQQIIRRELQTQPGEVVAVVREALGLLPLASRDVRVQLHPEDARFIREALGASDEDSWRIVEDPTVSRGGCRVITAASRIDATLELRLAALAAELLGGLREDDAKEDER
jgi:flagellar assembly protein FliH